MSHPATLDVVLHEQVEDTITETYEPRDAVAERLDAGMAYLNLSLRVTSMKGFSKPTKVDEMSLKIIQAIKYMKEARALEDDARRETDTARFYKFADLTLVDGYDIDDPTSVAASLDCGVDLLSLGWEILRMEAIPVQDRLLEVKAHVNRAMDCLQDAQQMNLMASRN